MSANADVTVVIPCFNHGAFVGEAVTSALRQRGGEPTVVVVDDGSDEPGIGASLDALPERVEVLRRANEGPAAARNAGAAQSSTPLLLFLDADDRLTDGALEALRAGLEADPACGYAYGVMRMFGAMSGEVRFPPFDPYMLLFRPIVGSPGTSLLRRSVFDEVGGYDPAMPGYEDWDLQLGALERGHPGRLVAEVTLEYRKHASSRLRGDRARHRHRFTALRRKHAGLYARAGEIGSESRLGPAGRLWYRTWWAWRPLPPAIEAAGHRLVFR